jgi:outer membrane lipoprotein LolB
MKLHARRLVLLGASAGVLWLAGCATPVSTVPEGTEAWFGRLALQVDSTPPQRFSAGFELRGNAREGEITLISPLGQALARATWTATGAELRRGNEQQQYANMDGLTTELTGTALPLAPLFDWLHGRATNADGWEADLSQHGEGRLSARRVFPNPEVRLRLVFQ